MSRNFLLIGVWGNRTFSGPGKKQNDLRPSEKEPSRFPRLDEDVTGCRNGRGGDPSCKNSEAPMTQKPPTMRSHTYGSPECASEGSAGTLTSPLKRVAILALGWSLVLGGIIG